MEPISPKLTLSLVFWLLRRARPPSLTGQRKTRPTGKCRTVPLPEYCDPTPVLADQSPPSLKKVAVQLGRNYIEIVQPEVEDNAVPYRTVPMQGGL